jgi:oligopeptide transport system substrate-binding protein
MAKPPRYLNLVLVLALVLAAVGFAATPATAQAEKRLVIAGEVQSTGDLPTIDPALVKDTASSQVAYVRFPPLVRSLEDNLGKIVPTVAEAMPTVSKDGKVYTFKLRKNIPWVMWDGTQVVKVQKDGKDLMVTAKDFEYGMKRMLDPKTASDYAYVFTGSLKLKGAEAFNSSKSTDAAELAKLRDAIGFKALDDFTLEMTIDEPIGYALGIIALPNGSAQPQAAIEPRRQVDGTGQRHVLRPLRRLRVAARREPDPDCKSLLAGCR